jgi:hypothetical protein
MSLMKVSSPQAESWFKGKIDDQTIAAFKKLYERRTSPMN